MDQEKIDQQLRTLESLKGKNWQRLIFVLRRHLDMWAHRNVRPNWGQMKLSYMPVIFNISVDGSTASEIAKKSMVTKQAMSRTIKELESNGMIVGNKDKSDRRIERLELTSVGKQLILDANLDQLKMVEIYKELVGEKDLDIAVNVLNKIISYHENLDLDEAHLED